MTVPRRLRGTAAVLTAPARLAVRVVTRALAAALHRGEDAGSRLPQPGVTDPPVAYPPAAPTRSAPPAAPAPLAEESPLYASDLPVAAYDALNAKDAVAAVKELTDADQVRMMLRYEEENAKRTTVHRAVRKHLEWLEAGAAVLPS